MLTRPRVCDDELRSHRLRTRGGGRLPFIGTLCSAGLLAVLFAVAPKQFIHQVEISVTRQPIPYTQLFFNDPSAIPSRLRLDRPDTFAFTMINDEGRSRIYHFAVVMGSAGSSTVVTRGLVRLSNGERSTRTVAVKPEARKRRYLITVVLDESGQSIHFYGETS